MSKNHGPNERLLWVQVFAEGSTPSHLPAKNLEVEGDGDDEWEDMDEEEEDGEKVMQDKEPSSATTDNDAPECDGFVAHMDPDALGRFLEWSGLGKMDEATAFFLLMSFPFYEHEWDLVGYILDGVFGFNDDAENDEDMDETSQE
jgi:hypothetical protein